MESFHFTEGHTPVLMSIPHGGIALPGDLAGRLTPQALRLPDTDWHLDRLYDFAAALGVAILRAEFSRYAIDLNRPPDGSALYPGASNSELVPLTTFADEPIYRHGQAPEAREMARRREEFWQPYHARLADSLDEIKRRHGYAVLFDCHSIRSTVPRFFEGQLADFNLGTAGGASCHGSLRDRLAGALAGFDTYGLAVDGRFKGGYITRHYGAPEDGIHAFQLELSYATYMEEAHPFTFRDDLADKVRPALKSMLEAALDWRPE
jgi:N-formylglutamate deformylase